MTKEAFYESNQDSLDNAWIEHISCGEWGSGEDRINITDEMFWEFIEDKMESK